MNDIENEVIKFIESVPEETVEKMKTSIYKIFDDTFAAFLGFRHYHGNILRKSRDPKNDPFRWNISEQGYAKNIRMVTHKSLYVSCLLEMAEEKAMTVPNGWCLAELVRVMVDLRKKYKKESLVRENILCFDRSSKDKALILKYMLNATFSIICKHGAYRGINIGGYELVARGREKITGIVNQVIDSGGVVLAVNTDGLIYSGNQIDGDEYHHEKFKTAIFMGRPGAFAYGDDIKTAFIPRILVDMENWTPGLIDGRSNEEDRFERSKLYCERRRAKFLQELHEYMNQEEEKFTVDCSSITL